jgi:hypothetical protein
MDTPPTFPLPTPPPPQVASKTGPLLSLIGAAAIVVGSFLPWITVTSIFGTLSTAGTEGDGIITIVVGGVVGLFSILELTEGRQTKRAVTIGALVALVIGIFELMTVNDRIQEAGTTDLVRASVGIGIWAILGGAGLAVFGSLQHR